MKDSMPSKKSVLYQEGSCFAVPLRNGGFARGIVARMDGDGRIFAYFFGPRSQTLEELNCSGLAPDRAVLRGLCGDLGIIKREWHLVGTHPKWERSEWPMPHLFRCEESTGKYWLSRYDDDTLNFVEQIPASRDLEDQFPYDRLMGYGSVEIRLTKILADPVDSKHS